MHLGLTSLAFEQMTVDDIISASKQNGLTAVEWSEAHVKRGDLAEARRIRALSEETGIRTVSYHPVCGRLFESPEDFKPVLETAQALGTDTLTLNPPPATADEDPEALLAFAEAARQLADLAAPENIRLCFSCSHGSLLDSYIHILHFMEIVGRENVLINWQPNRSSSLLYNIYELKMLVPYVHHVYVFYVDETARHTPIIEGQDEWQQYLKVLKGSRSNSLLFKSYNTENFSAECALMRDWMNKTAAG